MSDKQHLCPELHLTLNLGTLYKTDLSVIFLNFVELALILIKL